MVSVDSIVHKFNSSLKKASAEMKKNKLTRPLYSILSGIGLIRFKHYLFGYLFGLLYHRNPTQKMKDEKKFFLEHAQELKAVYDSLEDDRSRSVFENILKYRVTYDRAYLKRSRTKNDLSTQYLVSELQFSDHEIIVDCGAYIGDTAKLFFKNVPGCKVIALEPDEKTFEILCSLKIKGLTPIKAGAWSEDTTVGFSDKGGATGGGSIGSSGNTKIEVKALDHLPECQTATYIKMDIEGAELEALKGAEKIITRERPKLAICIYHQPEDFFEIPLYIINLNPNYKLYVYHHNNDITETVLYAI